MSTARADPSSPTATSKTQTALSGGCSASTSALDELRRCAPPRAAWAADLRALVTVSPVRHWREGAVESSRSKAHLLSAAHEVIDSDDTAEYFPSYEIVMDELRDYRWYDRDMLTRPTPPSTTSSSS